MAILEICGTPLPPSASSDSTEAADWRGVTFSLNAGARGANAPAQQLALQSEDVLLLQLDNGMQWLLPAEDADSVLGADARDADAPPGVLRIGAQLTLGDRQARDGAGAWLLKSLTVFQQGPAGMTALAAAGTFQDKELENRQGLYRIDNTRWALQALENPMPASEQPALLFIHGTASSTTGSFAELWKTSARTTLAERYGNRIYGFEHRTLTDSPIRNALDLARALPERQTLHLISHSRGGMVGELLARANRLHSDPFTADELASFARVGQTQAEDATLLAELGKVLQAKQLRIERFVRVAAPVRGTTLASGRLDRWASVMLNVLGGGLKLLGLPVVCHAYSALKSFLLAVVRERTDASVLPGLAAMMPDSPLVALLNGANVEIDASVHVLAGSYQGDSLLSWLASRLTESFYGGQTDLVVNTPSMSGGAVRRRGLWQLPLAGEKVTHFSYFCRDESVTALLDALAGENQRFTELAAPSRQLIARSASQAAQQGPIALILPGIMGSHLAQGNNRIWLEPFSLVAGQMRLLAVNDDGQSEQHIQTDGWTHLYYQGFADYLDSQGIDARPFCYDWRLSIADSAQQFAQTFDQAAAEARQRDKPLYIAAHSMGGLVARLGLNLADADGQPRWRTLAALNGRLVQFGTPNQGAASMLTVLLGRDRLVRRLSQLGERSTEKGQFLELVRHYPGVLELLPWPDGSPQPDYLSDEAWRTLAPDSQTGHWKAPESAALQRARAVIEHLRQASLPAESCVYVAGRAPTPAAVRMHQNQLEIAWSEEGDGRVLWKDGCPPGLAVSYVDAAHGDLLRHAGAFADYLALMRTGRSSLPSVPQGARDSTSVLRFVAAPTDIHGLYPSQDELLAAALGGEDARLQTSEHQTPPSNIHLHHGSMANARGVLTLGAYANDSLRGTALFMDQLLHGQLRQAQMLGRYPHQPGETLLCPPSRDHDCGALVVGLGPIGELKPGQLTHSLRQGLLEYARQHAHTEGPALVIHGLLVGSGYGGLTVELGMRCWLDALTQANQRLADAGVGAQGQDMAVRIAELHIWEEEESAIILAASALQELVRERRYQGQLRHDGQVHQASGGYRGRQTSSGDSWQRVHITEGREAGSLRFTLVTDRARNEVNEEPNQRQLVDGLIRSATHSTADQPGLSRALFELMIPNGMKSTLHELRGLVLGVDAASAVYPWELMRDDRPGTEAPLATRIGLVRQLASPYGRRAVRTVNTPRMLTLGDTQSHLPTLAGAQQEASELAALYRDSAGFQVSTLIAATGEQLVLELFDGEYQVMHLAAHGEASNDPARPGGLVLDHDTRLTSAQISKLRHVPELVFLNCCHLGSMQADARPRWGELAASLATEFIEMGCKAVVAAGWAVDDLAAREFALTFHRAMLQGKRFGDALQQAREAAYLAYPQRNTWGAYQAYGDECYQLVQEQDTTATQDAPALHYSHVGQALGDLEQLHARIQANLGQTQQQQAGKRLAQIETACRARYFAHGAVRARLAAIYADLGDRASAIEHYRAALAQEDGGLSVKALEQLGNLEVRHAVERHAKGEQVEALALLRLGEKRLRTLLALQATSERHTLLASMYKRIGQLHSQLGQDHAARQALGHAHWLREMCEHYQQADQAALAQHGLRYYPLLNWLDGQALHHVRDGAAIPAHLDNHLTQARDDARQHNQREASFFHAVAEIDADRTAALWACLTGMDGNPLPLTEPEAQKQLLARYASLRARLSSAREWDSVSNQLDWLYAVWPADTPENLAIRDALQSLAMQLRALK